MSLLGHSAICIGCDHPVTEMLPSRPGHCLKAAQDHFSEVLVLTILVLTQLLGIDFEKLSVKHKRNHTLRKFLKNIFI